MDERVLRLFVSSPGDVPEERQRVEFAVERLNTEFRGRVRIEAIRWETAFYSAHDTFQRQIPEAADCDVVVAVFRARLGTPLPASFPTLPSGEPYPSGTAYEVLSAIEVRRAGKRVPDVYVFRCPTAPSVPLDAPDRAAIEDQWGRLRDFFDRWFRTAGGEFLAAFQDYHSTDDFARAVEDCLRQWLERRGFQARGPVWDRVVRGSPFPGLAAFGADRGGVFFGRELAVAQTLARLRDAGRDPGRVPFLLVVGGSGSGKSSLLRAGLLPRLVLPGAVPEVDLWRVAVACPAADPFRPLADALFDDAALGPELREGAFRTRELLARQLAGDPELAVAPLREALGRACARRQAEAGFAEPRPARLALAVDQAERLFAEAEAGAAAGFAALLSALARGGLAYVVMVLRGDSYPAFQNSPPLVALRRDGATFDLVPPSASELEEMVLRPAAACRPKLSFEALRGRSLAAALVADARGGDALPLLQMTLARLDAAEAARGDGVLRFADYRGMDAAVTETADAALDGLDEPARAELSALVTGLVATVTVDPATGAAVPVAAALDRAAFEARRPHRRALVERFVERRLLTAEGDGDAERVRPVHEALLRIWPRAVRIVAEVGHLVRVRHALEPIARDWAEADPADRPRHLDVSPALLAGAQALVASFEADVSPALRDFVAASTAAAEARAARERDEAERRVRDAEALAVAHRQTARRTAIGLALALALAALAGWQWGVARAQTREAQRQRDRAEHVLALATNTANGLVFDLAAKFRDAVGVPAATVEDILDRARKLQDQLTETGTTGLAQSLSQAQALVETARTLLMIGRSQAALDAAGRARALFEAASGRTCDEGELQNWIGTALGLEGDAQTAQGRTAEAVASFQADLAIVRRLAEAAPGNLVRQHNLETALNRVGDALTTQGALEAALEHYGAALAVAERSAVVDPADARWQEDLATSLDEVGGALALEGRREDALGRYRAALAIAERLASASPSDAARQRSLVVADFHVADMLSDLGRDAEALAAARAGLAVTARLASSDDSNALWREDLAMAQQRVGDLDLALGRPGDALDAYRASLATAERLAREDPADSKWEGGVVLARVKVGDALAAAKRVGEALDAYAAARTANDRLLASHPDDDKSAMETEIVRRVGDALRDQGRADDALAAYRAGAATLEALTRRQPHRADWLGKLAVLENRIGGVCAAGGRPADALSAYRAERDAAERRAALDPGAVDWQDEIASADGRVGDAMRATGDGPGALEAYGAEVAIRGRLAESHPADVRLGRALSGAYMSRGWMLQHQRDASGALAAFEASLEIALRLSRGAPDDRGLQRQLALAHQLVGGAEAAAGDLPAALRSYRDSFVLRQALVRADPTPERQADLVDIDERIGDVLLRQGDRAGALAPYGEALALRRALAAAAPKDARRQADLAAAEERMADLRSNAGDADGAIGSERDALGVLRGLAEAEPDLPRWKRGLCAVGSELGGLLAGRGRQDEALDADRDARRVCAGLADADAADAALRRSVADLDGAIGDALSSEGKPGDALAPYRASLDAIGALSRAAPDDADLARSLAVLQGRIGIACAASGRPDEARSAFAAGLAIAARLAARPGAELESNQVVEWLQQQMARLP